MALEMHILVITLQQHVTLVVSNHWTDWYTGMDYWTDIFLVFKHIAIIVVSLIESFWL